MHPVLDDDVTHVHSVVGYVYISPYLEEKIGLSDTCGVHNLHGMPGVMGGLAGVISAALAGTDKYGASIGTIFPSRNSLNITGGLGWTAQDQAQHQLYALLTTLGMAIGAGIITGALINFGGKFDPEKWYNDAEFWEMPDYDSDVEAGRADAQHHRRHRHAEEMLDGTGEAAAHYQSKGGSKANMPALRLDYATPV